MNTLTIEQMAAGSGIFEGRCEQTLAQAIIDLQTQVGSDRTNSPDGWMTVDREPLLTVADHNRILAASVDRERVQEGRTEKAERQLARARDLIDVLLCEESYHSVGWPTPRVAAAIKKYRDWACGNA